MYLHIYFVYCTVIRIPTTGDRSDDDGHDFMNIKMSLFKNAQTILAYKQLL